MTLFKSVLATLFILIGFSVTAQHEDHVQRCGMDEIMAQMIAEDPSLETAFLERIAYMDSVGRLNSGNKKSSGVVYQIPVVFHVMYNSEYDNISKAQILDGLRVLNEDFRRLNADTNLTRAQFKSVAADTEIEFVMATKDPSGNCTDGITRTQTTKSVNAYDNIKTNRWPVNKYINVWIVNSISSSQVSDNVLGYGHFPYAPWYDPNKDGVVIRHDAVGSIGTAANAGRMGRTLPHEIGHNLGLYHPFGYVGQNYSCNYSDGIPDTPPVLGPSFGCDLNRNTCGNTNQIENFMDYADDACVNMFTVGQRNAMRSVAGNERSNLISGGNLVNTGVLAPLTCAPTASISIESPSVCVNQPVSFSEVSNGSAATSWKWIFPGGLPTFSNQKNPIVTYPGPGTYDVSLVVTNAAGTDSTYFTKFVTVRPTQSGIESSWSESFEGNLNPGMSIGSPEDNNSFVVTGSVASDGSKSMKLDNFTSGAYAPMTTLKGGGARDEIITPNIYALFSKNLTMTFDYAFAARNSSSNYDALRVYASEDCGQSWNLIRIFQSGLLRTAPDQNGSAFTPSAGQWRNGLIPLAGFDGKGPFLIKFEFENGGGNNFYIDNIQLTSNNVSITEYELAENVSVYPNPSNGEVNLKFNSETQSNISLKIYDLSGRQVYAKELPMGTTDYKVSGGNKLPRGVYMLQLEEGGMTYSERLVVK